MLTNLAETLHSSAKWKNKQVAKIWGLQLEKQKSGPKMCLPECLEDTPFNYIMGKIVNQGAVFTSLSYSPE